MSTSRVPRSRLQAHRPVPPIGPVGEGAFWDMDWASPVEHLQAGLAWVGWKPHLTGRWRLWRTDDRPLEVEGIALTPRGAALDRIPPTGGAWELLAERTGEDLSAFDNLRFGWPDHRVTLDILTFGIDNADVLAEGRKTAFEDVVVIRTDGGQWVLAWTSHPRWEVLPPVPGEVIVDRRDAGGPLRLANGQPEAWNHLSCQAQVFDTAQALRDYVDINEPRSEPLVGALLRWAVDVAAEFAPELDTPTTATTV